MKLKKKRALAAKKVRIAAGTNNGWLNFALAISCKNCESQDVGDSCEYRGYELTEEKGCVRAAYEAKKEGREVRF